MPLGILDYELDLKPLARISPSRYSSLLECRLREVWSAGHEGRLLPLSPAARLGLVVHALLKDAVSGKLAYEGKAEITKRWNELILEVESDMRNSWMDAHLTPLRESIRDYEVRRIRAINHVVEMVSSEKHRLKQFNFDKPLSGSEVWVQSDSGLIGGFIDRVCRSEKGLIIQDYKTGSIHDQWSQLGNGQIREGYKIQLKLYAALYAKSSGTWPQRIELVPLSRKPVSIDYDPQNCLRLLDHANRTLNEVNAIINSSSLTREKMVRTLASPSAHNCRFCAFRPGCEPYQATRKSHDTKIADWPHDVLGEIVSISQVGNQNIVITVRPKKNNPWVLHIRDINPMPQRHPVLEHIKTGDIVGLYNLRAGGSSNTFSESSLAVIYKHFRRTGEEW